VMLNNSTKFQQS